MYLGDRRTTGGARIDHDLDWCGRVREEVVVQLGDEIVVHDVEAVFVVRDLSDVLDGQLTNCRLDRLHFDSPLGESCRKANFGSDGQPNLLLKV